MASPVAGTVSIEGCFWWCSLGFLLCLLWAGEHVLSQIVQLLLGARSRYTFLIS